jgi:hypothetical protein
VGRQLSCAAVGEDIVWSTVGVIERRILGGDDVQCLERAPVEQAVAAKRGVD